MCMLVVRQLIPQYTYIFQCHEANNAFQNVKTMSEAPAPMVVDCTFSREHVQTPEILAAMFLCNLEHIIYMII